jgi:hypothetical protein
MPTPDQPTPPLHASPHDGQLVGAGGQRNLISKHTATDIALAYREIEVAEALLVEVDKARRNFSQPDLRDRFGRSNDGLKLGVPGGDSSHQMFNVPWDIARPVIETQIAHQRARLAALCITARIELGDAPSVAPREPASVVSLLAALNQYLDPQGRDLAISADRLAAEALLKSPAPPEGAR